MQRVQRDVVRDRALSLEGWRLRGQVEAFPAHFHDYYVLGVVEEGRRRLQYRGVLYDIGPGDLLLFNPGDPHACVQDSGEGFDYRSLHLPVQAAETLWGPMRFACPVVRDWSAAASLRRFHQSIMEGRAGETEPLTQWVRRYAVPLNEGGERERTGVETACAYMASHYAQRLTLQDIARPAGMSVSTLLRAFARTKGVTPHVYLESLRISAAQVLLERGMPPSQAALETGFSDQSHFTHRFTRLLGLPPGVYRDSAERTRP